MTFPIKAAPVPAATMRALESQVKDLTDANHMLETQATDLREQLHDTRRRLSMAWEELDEERQRCDEERRRAERAEARLTQLRESSRRRRRSSSSSRDRHRSRDRRDRSYAVERRGSVRDRTRDRSPGS